MTPERSTPSQDRHRESALLRLSTGIAAAETEAEICKAIAVGLQDAAPGFVEDDADTRAMLRRSLEKEGWRVSEAANGRVGLERVAAEPPALVLLDLMMPEMDGFEFLQGLRTRPGHEDLDIVVMTAKELTEDDRRRLSGGVSRVLQKGGHSPEEFLAEVRARVATTGSAR